MLKPEWWCVHRTLRHNPTSRLTSLRAVVDSHSEHLVKGSAVEHSFQDGMNTYCRCLNPVLLAPPHSSNDSFFAFMTWSCPWPQKSPRSSEWPQIAAPGQVPPAPPPVYLWCRVQCEITASMSCHGWSARLLPHWPFCDGLLFTVALEPNSSP